MTTSGSLLAKCENDLIEDVIAYVEENRALYDLTCNGYKNNVLKKNIFLRLEVVMKGRQYKDGKELLSEHS